MDSTANGKPAFRYPNYRPMTDEEFASEPAGPRHRHEKARRALEQLRSLYETRVSTLLKIDELEKVILDCAGGTS